MKAAEFLSAVSNQLGLSMDAWSGKVNLDAVSVCVVWDQTAESKFIGLFLLQWTSDEGRVTDTSYFRDWNIGIARRELANKLHAIDQPEGTVVIGDVSYFTVALREE